MHDARTVLERRLGEARRHLLHRRAVREAGPENQLISGGGELAEHAFGILGHEDVVNDRYGTLSPNSFLIASTPRLCCLVQPISAIGET